MKRVLLVLCTIWCAAFFASCGTSSTVNPSPDRNSNFTVTLEEGVGSFTPDVQVAADASGAVVTIKAENASELAAAYLHLQYDSSRYTPDHVRFGDMLGSGEQVLTLALTNLANEVPVGICQVESSGVQPVDGSGVLATVSFKAVPFAGSRSTSIAPLAALNAVVDLAIVNQDATTTTLRWTERHPGDTDNNGEVNLADLTNVGKYLNKVVADEADPLAASMADCNGDGTVTPAELTTIGQNYQTTLSGYVIYTDAAATQAYNNGEVIDRSQYWEASDPIKKNHPVVYTVGVPLSNPAFEFTVRPTDVLASGGNSATPKSNPALSIVVPGDPDAPSNLNAVAGDLIGSGKVRLTWFPSTATDVISYEIQRKTINPDSPFVTIATVPASLASYIDSDPTLVGQEYGYQIRAVDITGLFSPFSSQANATPWFLPPPSPPVNVAATTHPTLGSAVRVDWDAPGDGSAGKFRVYRQGPGEPGFTMVKQTINSSVLAHDDVNLTAFDSYNYYVTSLSQDGVTESAPSATVTATASEEQDIQLVSIDITNGKTTHHNSGSEIGSDITVVTNPSATSYNWTGPGAFTGSGASVSWKPNASTPLGKNTLTVTATKGAKSVQGTVEVFVTSQPILTNFGDAGRFIPWSDRASKNAPNPPYIPVMNYIDGNHVALLNMWGTWCPPCRAELPFMDAYAAHYGPGGNYVHIGTNGGGSDTLQMAIDFLNSQGLTALASPANDNYFPADTALWGSEYGYTGWPTSLLVDRDGYIRIQAVGRIDMVPPGEAVWNTTIAHLTGMPEM